MSAVRMRIVENVRPLQGHKTKDLGPGVDGRPDKRSKQELPLLLLGSDGPQDHAFPSSIGSKIRLLRQNPALSDELSRVNSSRDGLRVVLVDSWSESVVLLDSYRFGAVAP